MSAATALSLLRAHLDHRASHGTKRVGLSKEARLALRALIQNPLARRGTASASLATASASIADGLGDLRSTDTTAIPAAAFASAFATANAAAEEQAPAPSPESLILTVPGATVEQQLATLATMAEADPQPRALRTLRQTMVFGSGSARSAIMFIGEAPGLEEEQQRQPFVGPAGQLLSKIITAMGLQRADVYLTNVCKYCPSNGDIPGSSIRPPTLEEMRASLPYVMTEIALIKPQVIIALGAAASAGLGIEGPLGRNRGRAHSIAGARAIVTYHPSYLIREEERGGRDAGTKAKRLVWEDMLAAMQHLGLSISDKQRGYFRSAA